MKKVSFLFAICFLLSLVTFASEHGHGHNEIVIPIKTVMWQSLNLVVLFLALGFVLRKTIRSFFAGRQDTFLQQAAKAKTAREAAEKQYLDILHKIKEIGANQNLELDQVRKEAAALKIQMIKEAQEVAERIKKEASSTVALELQRAQQQIKEAILKESLKIARSEMSRDLASGDYQKLNTDFVSNLEVAL